MDEVLKAHCYFLTHDEARQFRAWYWPYLERAIADAEGRVEPEAVWREIEESRAAVFVVTVGRDLRAAATVTIHQNETARWAEIELCGGDEMADWVEIGIEAIRKYAQFSGCDYLMFEGRRGWEKFLKPMGFETRRIQATLRLH